MTNFISIKMNFTFIKLVIIFLLLKTGIVSYGQTYTSNGTCTDWSNGNCWTKVNDDASSCTNSTSLHPPANPTGCPVRVAVNHAMSRSTTITFGGNFQSINFGPNGSLNIAGGLEISSNYTLNVYGNSSGSDNYITTSALNLNQNSTIFIDEYAGLIITGLTTFKSQNGKVKVDGFYRTNSITTTGNSSGTLEVDLNAKALVEGNVDMNGNSKLFFTGSGTDGTNAEVEIGGRIKTNGTGSEITADKASVYICDGIDAAVKRTEINNGKFVTMCRALNIEGLNLEVKSNAGDKNILIIFTLLSLSEEHLFVLEKSLDGIDDFKEIGAKYGGKMDLAHGNYTFVDMNFPLSATWAYYRIKQIEGDKILNYSNIVRARIPRINNTNAQVWQVYPNPFENTEDFELKLINPHRYGQEEILFRIISVQYTEGPFSAKDEYDISYKLKKQLEMAPRGLIIVELRWGEKKEYLKLLKR